MSASSYLKDHFWTIIINIVSMIFLSVFLLLVGNTMDTIIVILLSWCIIFALFLLISYQKRKHYLDGLTNLSINLEERYLLPQVMTKPHRSDDQVFYQLLKTSGKSMLEKIGESKQEQKEYTEYIEHWIHEVKTPITALKLLTENHKSDDKKLYLAELEKLNHYVEQTLFYARSGYTQQDYLIRETNLEEVVHWAIGENKQLLLQNQAQIQLKLEPDMANTDSKWIVFILSQLIQNSVKYSNTSPIIELEITSDSDKAVLSIKDHGIGILESDMPRIFDKGFTGNNGRSKAGSTGIGLYLCKHLCQQLNVGLTVSSTPGTGTIFHLIFYKKYGYLLTTL